MQVTNKHIWVLINYIYEERNVMCLLPEYHENAI